MKYGYSRVSTNKQEFETQISKLEKNGAAKIFSEKFTGTKKDGRVELEHLLQTVQSGDEVLITKIDRLARSIVDLNNLIMEFNNKGVTVNFIDNSLIFEPHKKDAMNTLMMNMLGSFAQFERDLIVNRTIEGKQWAREHKVNYSEGRPKRVLTDRYKAALKVMETETIKQTSLITGISTATLTRIKRQAREE